MSSGIIMGNVTIDDHTHYVKGNMIFSTGKENGMVYYTYDIINDIVTYNTKQITGARCFIDFKQDLDEAIRHHYLSTYVHNQEE